MEKGFSISDLIKVLIARITTDKKLPFDINRMSSECDGKIL
ncbi:type II toxin-antitoxin system RelB/DinJ family antitoxin [Tatumella punctata]|uniref:Type II toxin-antitoxin system RelB/DinJ family antitoxin n=1 Tax=Tatumella punctata TaxID=399969 RepID=A0ABW1VNE8_9GAMM